MPVFDTSYVTEKCVRQGSRGDVTWVMAGQGFEAAVSDTVFTPMWFVDAKDMYLGARLTASMRDATANDAYVAELWAVEQMTSGGILTARFTVAPLAFPPPSMLRTLGVVGCPGQAWGVRARMTTGTARQIMFQLTLFCRHIGQGLIYSGEGVTGVIP